MIFRVNRENVFAPFDKSDKIIVGMINAGQMLRFKIPVIFSRLFISFSKKYFYCLALTSIFN